MKIILKLHGSTMVFPENLLDLLARNTVSHITVYRVFVQWILDHGTETWFSKKNRPFTTSPIWNTCSHYAKLSIAVCFLKWCYPKMDGLEWKTLLKWVIWGYHHFRKPSLLCVLKHTHFLPCVFFSETSGPFFSLRSIRWRFMEKSISQVKLTPDRISGNVSIW